MNRTNIFQRFFSLFTAFTVLLASVAFSQEEELPFIDEVEIVGNKVVNQVLIKKQLQTQKGKKFSRIDVNNDIKRLYKLNYFSKIDVDIVEKDDLFKVVFVVQEKPVVGDVILKGNRKIKTKILTEKLTVKSDQLLNEKVISDDVVTLKNFYEEKGYKQVTVNAEFKEHAEKGLIDVIFDIDEGKKIKIKEINITGNVEIKEKKILKIMKTKKNRWYNTGFYDDEKFQEDLERIKAFYYQKGYVDIKILGVEEEYIKNNTRLILNIAISEGRQYRVNKVEVKGNENFPEEQILKVRHIEKGEIYLPEDLSKDLKEIKNFYFRQGYIDVAVDVKTFVSEEDPYLLNVTFDIQENEISFIDKINIVGNEKTKDIVVRRELNLSPGERFDGVRMDIARQRLQNLGLFKSVDIYADPAIKEPQRDLFVEVEEDRTGELGFGAGYSSVDNLIGFLEISQGNFDLFNFPSFTGDAQKLKLRSEFGKRKQEFLIDFTEPWMFERRLLFGFKLYTRSREYQNSDFSEERNGALLRFAKPIFKYSRGEISYLYENVTVENVDDDASEFLKAQEGERDVGKLGFQIVRDVRDSFFNATRGSRISLDLDLAGVGGDTNYYRGVFNADLYFNPWFNNIFIASFRTGGIKEYGDSDEVPIFDRFFLGGAWSIRGFDYRDIGPHDEKDEPLGGKFMYYGTFEYVVPVIDQFHFAMFCDYGNLYSDFDDIDWGEINVSLGLGLRIMLDARIPLRFDYAWPVETDEYHEGEGGKFTFDIGHRF